MVVALLPQSRAPPLVAFTSSQVAPSAPWLGQKGPAMKRSPALMYHTVVVSFKLAPLRYADRYIGEYVFDGIFRLR